MVGKITVGPETVNAEGNLMLLMRVTVRDGVATIEPATDYCIHAEGNGVCAVHDGTHDHSAGFQFPETVSLDDVRRGAG